MYLPETNVIRTGTELSYEWIHRRPAKKLEHTFGAALLYNYMYRDDAFYGHGEPFYYTEVENDLILFGTAGLRKTFPSKLFLFGTTGLGLLVPANSLEVSDSRRYFSTPPHPMRIDRLKANLMFKFGIGYTLKSLTQ
jgi:hypothetical protein